MTETSEQPTNAIESNTLLAECLDELERLQGVVCEEDYKIIQALLDKANVTGQPRRK